MQIWRCVRKRLIYSSYLTSHHIISQCMFNGDFIGITIVENVHLSSTIRTFMCDCWWNTQPQQEPRTDWQYQQIIHVSSLTLNLASHKSYLCQCFSDEVFTSYLLWHYGNLGHTTEMWHWTAMSVSQIANDNYSD